MAQKTHDFSTRQKMKRNTFEIFHYRDDYMKDVALHHHDFYEIYYFLSGNVTYNVESRNYQLSPGDVLVIGPNELHQPVFGPEQHGYERIVLWINGAFLQQFSIGGMDASLCFDTARPNHSNLLHPGGTGQEHLYYLMLQLLQESESNQYGSELWSMGCLAQILALLNRTAIHSVRGEQEPRSGADSVVYRVLGYINEHFSEDLSLDFLANKFFISKYHLSREFGRIVGTSVYRYIIQKRLVMAKQMMTAGVSSTTVYQHCGFGDYSNFYRAFKAEYQISPKEFMLSLKEETFHRAE